MLGSTINSKLMAAGTKEFLAAMGVTGAFNDSKQNSEIRAGRESSRAVAGCSVTEPLVVGEHRLPLVSD